MGKENKCIFYNPRLIEMAYGSLAQDMNKCGGNLTLHHVRYAREGRIDHPSNLLPVCRFHQNWLHSAKMEEIWRERENG